MLRWWCQLSVASLAILCVLTGCGSPIPGVTAVEVNGDGTLGLSVPGQPVKGLIVYFHGMNQKPDVIIENPNHKALFEPLLRSGYAVVSGDAGSRAFGNPRSREQYRELIAAAQAKYATQPKLFVAESMGALAALALLGEQEAPEVRGLVGISPLMGLPPEIRSVNYIADAWSGEVPDSADPLTWPPQAFAGRAMLLYQSAEDRIIPAAASAQAFATRFGPVADIDVVRCGGDHVADDCYDPAGIQKWMAGLG